MNICSEADALDDMSDGGAEDDLRELEEERYHESVESDRNSMRALYADARRAQVGATIRCSTCRRLHVKTTYHKVFCSNGRTKGKGKRNCKDGYWNFADRQRCERATRYA